MEDIQQSYSEDQERICLTSECPKKNKKIKIDDLSDHQNHYLIGKIQTLDKIKVLKCNQQNKYRKKIQQTLDGMMEKFIQLQRQFNRIYLPMLTNFYQYVKLVKNSFQDKEYQQLYRQISKNFYSPKVVSAFNKAAKYERIAFPYDEYPLEMLDRIKKNFQKSCGELKMAIENDLSGFKQQLQQINIFNFLDVRPTQQIKFSKYLKNDVYEVKECQMQIQRVEQNTVNFMNMVVGAVALIQKQMKVDTQISFKIQCLPKTHACAIGLCNLQKAKELNFKGCLKIGYYMTSSNGMLKKSQPVGNKNSAGWTFEEGDIITMKLCNNYLSWWKKGFITPYFASMMLRKPQENLYPAIQIWGTGGKISIVK